MCLLLPTRNESYDWLVWEDPTDVETVQRECDLDWVCDMP